MAVSRQPDFLEDAQARYTEAVERRAEIEAMWISEGRPLLASGSTGQLVEHPLVKMLREHDLLVSRLGESARKRHRGPEPSAVLKAAGLPPPLENRMRRVK